MQPINLPHLIHWFIAADASPGEVALIVYGAYRNRMERIEAIGRTLAGGVQ